MSDAKLQILLTGAAGFIGSSVAKVLLDMGHNVVGVDNLNTYYDVSLKKARLERIQPHPNFSFHPLDFSDRSAMETLWAENPAIKHIISLGAQAGVRYSLEDPFSYVQANITGHLVLLELCRHRPDFQHFVYASSSSVYGGNTKIPFSTADRVDLPISMYAATKRAGELMAQTYNHLFKVPATGLRFFTVYGPWGRPDMAAYLFADAIMHDRPIKVFNDGNMRRDFTFIDDIVQGVIAALFRDHHGCHKVYNLGNHKSESLLDFIAIIEQCLGKKAKMDLLPIQPGDVQETYADIEDSQRDLGFEPTTAIAEGIPKFIDWFLDYHDLQKVA